MEFSLDLQKKFSVIKVHLPSTLLTRTNTLYGVLILCLFWYSIKLYSLKLKYKSLHLLCGCKACILIQKFGMFVSVWCFKKKGKTHTRKCFSCLTLERGVSVSTKNTPLWEKLGLVSSGIPVLPALSSTECKKALPEAPLRHGSERAQDSLNASPSVLQESRGQHVDEVVC